MGARYVARESGPDTAIIVMPHTAHYARRGAVAELGQAVFPG